MAASAVDRRLPKFIAKFYEKYVHNTHFFNGPWAKNLEQSTPAFAKANNGTILFKQQNKHSKIII